MSSIDVDLDKIRDLDFQKKAWLRHKQIMDGNYEDYKSKGIKSDQQLKEMIKDKGKDTIFILLESRKLKMEEIQNRQFMKKF